MSLLEIRRYIDGVVEVCQGGRWVIGPRFKHFPSPFYDEVFLILGEAGKGEGVPDEGVGEAVVLLNAASYKVLPSHEHRGLNN